MEQSKLPDQLKEQTIDEMPQGVFFTVPWAMFADKDGRMWINGKYTYDRRPRGTVQLKITREPKSGHILVDKNSIGDHRYSRSGDTFVGGASWLPVTLVKDL